MIIWRCEKCKEEIPEEELKSFYTKTGAGVCLNCGDIMIAVAEDDVTTEVENVFDDTESEGEISED